LKHYFALFYERLLILYAMWWCYPTPSEGWERAGTPQRSNSRATPQDLDQRSKMKEVPQTIGGDRMLSNPSG